MHLDNQDVMHKTETAEETFAYAAFISLQSISKLNSEGMFPVEEDVLLLTKGEEPEKEPYTTIDDLLENISESVYVKLENCCFRTTPTEVKEKMTTMFRDNCPSFSLLSQEDPKEQSSQISLSN